MERRKKAEKELMEMNKRFMEKTGPGCKTAMGVALHKAVESQKVCSKGLLLLSKEGLNIGDDFS
jgi:hypothetical protein